VSATPTVQAAFSMPGRSLLVLPVGLGVFGSITGITIIIVALVTIERVRYRRVSSPVHHVWPFTDWLSHRSSGSVDWLSRVL
jgi:hypothetical protein